MSGLWASKTRAVVVSVADRSSPSALAFLLVGLTGHCRRRLVEIRVYEIAPILGVQLRSEARRADEATGSSWARLVEIYAALDWLLAQQERIRRSDTSRMGRSCSTT